MSPSHNSEQIITNNLKSPIMNSHIVRIVHVDGGEVVAPSSLEKNEIHQKPLITDNNNSIILRYLRGYNIFPLSSVNLPPGMSLDLFRESLLEDARFYGFEKLAQLLQAETPSPLRYKDPFTSTDKILLSLRDVPIHKDFIKSKLEDNDNNSTVEFFTGAVLTIEFDASNSSLCFKTKFLNEQDEKALKTLGEICGKDSAIELSRHLSTSWNMSDTLNGIRLEIDGVQVTGVDLASLVGAHNSGMKALEDMLRSSGGERLIIYAQEFVFRLDNLKKPNKSNNNSNNCYHVNGHNDDNNGCGSSSSSSSSNDVDVNVDSDVIVDSDVVEHDNEEDNVEEVEEDYQNNNGKDVIVSNGKDKNVESKGDDDCDNNDKIKENNDVYLGVVWAKGWTQEWWAWNEYRMKLDTLQ
nr:7831_t:CDS:2 [Entrophospora candida]